MNIQLIIYNKEIENPNVFNDRIKALGDTFYIFDNIVFVETDYSTKDVYERISANEYESTSMLILNVRNEMLGFWGRMNTKLWTWLDEKEEKSKNGFTNGYIKEIMDRDQIINELKIKNEENEQQIEEYKRTTENLYKQIEILRNQIETLNK